jgi:hypothetical protein
MLALAVAVDQLVVSGFLERNRSGGVVTVENLGNEARDFTHEEMRYLA